MEVGLLRPYVELKHIVSGSGSSHCNVFLTPADLSRVTNTSKLRELTFKPLMSRAQPKAITTPLMVKTCDYSVVRNLNPFAV